MVRTLSQVLIRAVADAGEGRHVALAPELAAELEADPGPKTNGAVADVALVMPRAITPRGEIDVEPRPDAREIWAILPPDAARGGFVAALSSTATARATRIYHPLAIAEVRERGLVLVEVVKGTSARDVARVLGVPCFAGPELAEWREPPATA